MFEKIKKLYELGKLTESGVREAFAKGWITKKEMEEILSINN